MLIPRGLSGKLIWSIREGRKYIFACAGKDGLYRVCKDLVNFGLWDYVGFQTTTLGTRGVVDVAVLGNNDEIICVGIGNDDSLHPGLMRSSDGGETWTRSDSNLVGGQVGSPELTRIHSADFFAISAITPGLIYTVNSWNSSVYWSHDSGAHWERTDNPGTMHGFMGLVEIEPLRPERVWAAGGNWGDMAPLLQRSTRNGIDWRYVQVSPYYYQNNGIGGIGFGNVGEVYLALRHEVAYSTDDGASWAELVAHNDSLQVFSVFVDPHDPSHLFVAGQQLPFANKRGVIYEYYQGNLEQTYRFDHLLIGKMFLLSQNRLFFATDKGIYEAYGLLR